MRFPIRFTGAGKAMVAIGITRSNSFVEVDGDQVTVRLGWSFRSSFPLSSVVSAAADAESVYGWGAHGWRGKWLVNGSSSQLVRLDLEPEARARVLGFPVRLSVLRVSVEDPEALIAALV